MAPFKNQFISKILYYMIHTLQGTHRIWYNVQVNTNTIRSNLYPSTNLSDRNEYLNRIKQMKVSASWVEQEFQVQKWWDSVQI